MKGRMKGLIKPVIGAVIGGQLLAGALFGQTATTLEEGKRLALVIGNDSYPNRPLQNAVNDARVMQKALSEAGFRVLVRENAGVAAMQESMSEFLSQIGPGDTVLLYYAGHAVQIEGENVLIPSDFASARTIIEAKYKSLSLTPVFDVLKRSRAKRVIVILDACRTNPVAETYALKAGLANPSDAGKNTYLAFSTSPGMVAGDNPNGRNSWFTEALAQAISQPGLSLDEVFTRVRLQVEVATGGKQTPWSITSLTSKFYFYPPKDGVTETDGTLLSKWLEDARRQEQHGNWQESVETYQRIVKEKSGGSEEAAATARLPYVQARMEAEAKFAAGDLGQAIDLAERALSLDGFAMDAAFEIANSALLGGDLPRAIGALGRIRQRGTSAQVARAARMLEELARVERGASEVLGKSVAQAPPLGELCPDMQFGIPNWEAVRRWSRQELVAVDYAAMAKQWQKPAPAAVRSEEKPPQAPADTVLSNLHLVVKPVITGRDLISEESGELKIQSLRREMALVVDGRQVSKQLPATVSLPAGEYDLQTMAGGRKVSERRIRVKGNSVTEVELR